MKPVHQTKFGKDEGNCLQAAIASVLELPLEEVPDFGTGENWFGVLREFLKQYDLWPLLIQYDKTLRLHGFSILGGKSPRGDFLHSVVARNGKIVHDPHPDNTGLEAIEDVMVFVAFLSSGIPPTIDLSGNGDWRRTGTGEWVFDDSQGA